MMDATISLSTLFWICSGIAGLYAVYKIIKGPFIKLDDHERRINKLEEDRKERREADQLILRTLNAMVNHLIDGNNTTEMISVRKDLQNNIINHTK